MLKHTTLDPAQDIT